MTLTFIGKLKIVIDNYKMLSIYQEKISDLENENNFLKRVINTLQKTVEKFIHWVCYKFSGSEEDELVRNFEFENDTYIDPVKQIEYEDELNNEIEF